MSAASTVVQFPSEGRSPIDVTTLWRKLGGQPLEFADGADSTLACCLVHEEETPSCSVDRVKNVFHCFSCGAKGGCIDLIRNKLDLDRNEATQWARDNGLLAKKNDAVTWAAVDQTYDYQDVDGNVIYQVGRFALEGGGKTFKQRAPDGKGGWYYTLSTVKERVLYNLPALIKAIARGETVYVVEGERDVQTLALMGAIGTTCMGGASAKWNVAWAQYFANANVVVLADYDDVGRAAAKFRAETIASHAKSVRVVYALPGAESKKGFDLSDWVTASGSGASLSRLEALSAELGETVEPYTPPYKTEALAELVTDLSDAGNGKWFSSICGDVARFIAGPDKWYCFNGKVWVPNANTQELILRAKDAMQVAAKDYGGPLADDFEKHVKLARNAVPGRHMLTCAQAHLGMLQTDFNKRPHLLNVENGTLDLHTHELRAHVPEDYLTLMSSITYDAAATCPNFEQWLRAACNSDELFDYMQQVMGSCLEGRVGLRRFYHIHGPKGTGKSTFIRTMDKLLGDYSKSTDIRVLASTDTRYDTGNGPSPALARLKGARMVSVTEVGDDKLDSNKIKKLIGGDLITARHLQQEMDEFSFEATLILSGNEFPRISGDESIWDKLKPVPFIHAIEAEDPDFESKVIDPELSGILNFALRGLDKLRANNYKLPDPPEIVAAREQEKERQDPYAEWYDLNVEAGTEAPIDEVYANYTRWCERRKQHPFQQAKVTKWLKAKGVTVRQSNVHRWYVGIVLKRGVSQDSKEF